jgi:signal transduction histidine kinase
VSVQRETEVTPWREALLNRLLLALTPLILAATAAGISVTHRARTRLLLATILPAVSLNIAALFKRNWPYQLRAAILIAPLVWGACAAYYVVGFSGNGSLIAACAIVLTGLFLGRRIMFVMLGSLALAVIMTGVGMVSGAIPFDELEASARGTLPWVRSSLVACVAWAMLGTTILFVVERVEKSLARTERALFDLREEEARRRQAEQERRAAQESALEAQKMELVGKLAAGVAHDFNNLLGVVAGWTELGVDEHATAEDRAQAREELLGAVQHGKALTRQLLALARRDARVVNRVHLGQVASQGIRVLRRVVPPNVQLSFREAEAVQVDADETEMQQVLFNLVLNARDAIPSGKGQIEVTTGVTTLETPLQVIGGTLPSGPWALLRVKDSGTGIDAAIRERIFELFFTTKPVGLGTGLGLATVLRIAQLSGGGVALESTPSHGSTFTLYLPRAS